MPGCGSRRIAVRFTGDSDRKARIERNLLTTSPFREKGMPKMPRALKRTINVHDSMIRELVELDSLFAEFKIVEVGKGEERSIVLVAKTPEEKQKLADELAKAGASQIEP
jgi:hypothetical protein